MQTAVEWLKEQFDRQRFIEHIDFEKAKEMEKQQIIDAFTKGADDGFNGLYYENREQYYSETYENGEQKVKEYPNSHIYETMNGRYGLSSYEEHDQTDGIFDTYQEAVDFGLSLINNPTSSQTEISDEEIEMAALHNEPRVTRRAFKSGAKWYREQLKQRQ